MLGPNYQCLLCMFVCLDQVNIHPHNRQFNKSRPKVQAAGCSLRIMMCLVIVRKSANSNGENLCSGWWERTRGLLIGQSLNASMGKQSNGDHKLYQIDAQLWNHRLFEDSEDHVKYWPFILFIMNREFRSLSMKPPSPPPLLSGYHWCCTGTYQLCHQ